jgi:hypothetical protein
MSRKNVQFLKNKVLKRNFYRYATPVCHINLGDQNNMFLFRTYTAFVDDSHDDLPADIARRPEVPFWSGQEDNFANQTGK